jgi:hypothetical protein
MATLMAAPHLDIVSAQPGFSKITVSYSIIFDNNDRAVNQPYNDHVEIWGDDTNVGDPASAGGDDKLGSLNFGTVRPSMTVPLTPLTRMHTWTVPTSSLDEDKAPPTPNSDEVRAIVTLTPLAPKVVGPVESNLIQMLI